MWCILIPLIVGLLGFLLGRLFSKNNDEDITKFEARITELEADLDACSKSKLSLQADLDTSNKSKMSLRADLDAAAKASSNANVSSFAAGSSNASEVAELKAKVSGLEADLAACNKSKLSLQADLNAAKASATNVSSLAASGGSASATSLAFDAAAAKGAFGKRIKQDDLKIVEGIGPKIEGLFHNFGIKTWKDLSEASIEKCQEVLNSGGDRYRIHKPGTWPKQAKLAYEGKWKELAKWQDELDGGKA